MKPLVSVIVPAYNEEKLISRCINSLMSQSLSKEKYEIIVIDNNSTDSTSEISKKFGIKVVSYKEKQGFGVTKQFGVEIASGQIIAFCDADTLAEKNWLDTILNLMQDDKIMIVGGPALPSKGNIIINMLYLVFDGFARINQLFGNSLIWGFNMAIRKSAFLEVGGFNLNLTSGEDWDISARIRNKYGKGSSLYTNLLQSRTSSRKLRNPSSSFRYFFWGFINYFSIFISRKSVTYGKPNTIR